MPAWSMQMVLNRDNIDIISRAHTWCCMLCVVACSMQYHTQNTPMHVCCAAWFNCCLQLAAVVLRDKVTSPIIPPLLPRVERLLPDAPGSNPPSATAAAR